MWMTRPILQIAQSQWRSYESLQKLSAARSYAIEQFSFGYAAISTPFWLGLLSKLPRFYA